MDAGNVMPAAKVARLMGKQAIYKAKKKLDDLRAENPDEYQKGMLMASHEREGGAEQSKEYRREALREMLGMTNSKSIDKNLDKPLEERRNAAGDTYKKGGMTASTRADGCVSRGKTKGRFV
jgi:hypothetical protein